MPKMIALKNFPFGEMGQRVQLKKGELFDAKQKYARMLIATKLAVEYPFAPHPVTQFMEVDTKQAYATRHMEAAPAKARKGKPVSAMTSAELRVLIQKHHGNVRGLSSMAKPALVRLANKALQ